jgi:hypothetical protein
MRMQRQKKPNWYPTFEMLKDLLLTAYRKADEINTNPVLNKAFIEKRDRVTMLISELPSEDHNAMERELLEWKKTVFPEKVLDKKD